MATATATATDDLFFEELCRKAGYEQVDVETNPGVVRIVSTVRPAPYIEGNFTDVLRRLIRLVRVN